MKRTDISSNRKRLDETDRCIPAIDKRRDVRLEDALQLMRGFVTSPLGKNPKRDNQIKAAWLQGYMNEKA